MGYHSADYNHDWKIGVAELVRVTVLASTTNLGITTGCYKVDDTSIDGFAPDNTRAISDPVTLTKYHSADYNQDGRIDAGELARVTELYNFRYEDLNASGFVRTGQYHSDDPLTVDGFGLGPVYLSAYAFDTDHKPLIYANIVPSGDYILRAKFMWYWNHWSRIMVGNPQLLTARTVATSAGRVTHPSQTQISIWPNAASNLPELLASLTASVMRRKTA